MYSNTLWNAMEIIKEKLLKMTMYTWSDKKGVEYNLHYQKEYKYDVIEKMFELRANKVTHSEQNDKAKQIIQDNEMVIIYFRDIALCIDKNNKSFWIIFDGKSVYIDYFYEDDNENFKKVLNYIDMYIIESIEEQWTNHKLFETSHC